MAATRRHLLLASLGWRAHALDNGLALRPPMGWRSWNVYWGDVTQKKMEAAMDALVDTSRSVDGNPTSLLELGYASVGLDDGWQDCGAGLNGSFHDKDGVPLVDTTKFPSMSAMVKRAHSLGLKAGWYFGNCICSERGFSGPWAEAVVQRSVDALVVDYGFDGVKLDACSQWNNLTLWSLLINATGKAVEIENCHQGGLDPGATQWQTYVKAAAAAAAREEEHKPSGKIGSATSLIPAAIATGETDSNVANVANVANAAAAASSNTDWRLARERNLPGPAPSSPRIRAPRLAKHRTKADERQPLPAAAASAASTSRGASTARGGSAGLSSFEHELGYLSAGADLPSSPLRNATVSECEAHCSAHATCLGFSFESDEPAPVSPLRACYLKTALNLVPYDASNAECTFDGSDGDCPYNFYRTSGDIDASWTSMLANLETTLRFLDATPPLSRPGAWAYPDMMEVGLLANATEDRTHFGAWAISSSPLILGFDLSSSSAMDHAWPVISNREVIEVNQAWAGEPGTRILQHIDYQAWAKPLGRGRHALFLFSNASAPVNVSVPLANVSEALGGASAVTARDLYLGRDLGRVVPPNFTARGVAPHDARFVVLSVEKSRR